MPYEKQISRAEPGLIVFALDDSGSMADCLPGTSDAKYQWVERYVGIILKELLARSTDLRGDALDVKSRYYTRTVLYGSEAQDWGNGEMDIQATVEKFTEAGSSLGLGGHLSGTDAEVALTRARDYLRQAVGQPQFKQSFPPMVFHLTDGESQSDATKMAQEIRQLSTGDGNVLVVNAFIGTRTSLKYEGPADFPGYVEMAEAGPSEDSIRLFHMSSETPPAIHQNLVEEGIFPNLREHARLFFDVRTKEMLKHVIQVVGSLGSQADRHRR